MAETDPARGVQTALRALAILEAFSVARPTLTVTEVSEDVGLSVPTTHRLLKALRSRELIVFDPATHRYSLGHGIMRMARVIMERDDLISLAHSGLERLRTETSETASLQRLLGEQRTAVDELTSQHPIRMASGVGNSYSLVRGASGKVMLAFMPKRERDRLVQTSTEPAELARELAVIAERGYAESQGEVVAGAAAVAAPIFDACGAVVAAINVTGPAGRFTAGRMAAAVPVLLEVTDNVTRQLGGAVAARRVG